MYAAYSSFVPCVGLLIVLVVDNREQFNRRIGHGPAVGPNSARNNAIDLIRSMGQDVEVRAALAKLDQHRAGVACLAASCA